MTEFTVLEADYHRNGVGGEGFYVGLIQDHTNERRMILTVFPRYMTDETTLATYQDHVAVLDVDQAALGNVYMHPYGKHAGNNAWRGADHYSDAALAIIAKAQGESP